MRISARLGIAALAAAASAGSAWAGAPVEGGKVYSGPEGIRVSVVDLAPRSGNQAVVLVQGSGSELDGKALLHEVRGQGDRVDYRTQLHGRDFVTIAVRSSWGARAFTLAVPGRRDDVHISYDEKLSKELEAEKVHALHQKQAKDGTLRALQAFDRRGEEARHEKDFGAALESMNKACGTRVTGSIGWKSISDELMKHFSISSYCANPVSALERLCGSGEAKRVIRQKVKQVSCRFGPTLELEVKDGTVRWTTEQDAPNQEEFAAKHFEKNL